MTNINTVAITGRLIRDSEYYETNNGTKICKMTVVVSKDVYQNNEKTSIAKFFDIVLFGEIGKSLHKYLIKSKIVAITGELDQYFIEDESGNKKSKMRIIANRIQMIGGVNEQENNG